MDALQLNEFAAAKSVGAEDAPFIPALSTGSQPSSQGSQLAPVNDHISGDFIADNSVPNIDYPHHIAPVGTPGSQQQTVLPTAQVAPWISVPPCKGSKPIPKSFGIGITGDTGTGAVLNTPSKNNRRPRLFTAS
jgi:hypothetical protein